MIDRDTVELFLDKRIIFAWVNQDKRIFSSGVLKKVNANSMIIDFHGKTQAYSLESIISIREEEMRE